MPRKKKPSPEDLLSPEELRAYQREIRRTIDELEGNAAIMLLTGDHSVRGMLAFMRRGSNIAFEICEEYDLMPIFNEYPALWEDEMQRRGL
jgi:hypothetical protein